MSLAQQPRKGNPRRGIDYRFEASSVQLLLQIKILREVVGEGVVYLMVESHVRGDGFPSVPCRNPGVRSRKL